MAIFNRKGSRHVKHDFVIYSANTFFKTGAFMSKNFKEADAIIDIKYDFQAWYPVASGVAIKYVD